MHLQQLAVLGAVLMTASSSIAAPLNGIDQSSDLIQPIRYRTVNGAANRQALFSLSAQKRDDRRLARRKPSKALGAVITYVKRFTGSEDDADDDYVDDDEVDGSDPSHYYQPIGREQQKAFAVKRATGQCTRKATATSAAATATKTSSTTTAKTTSKATLSASPPKTTTTSSSATSTSANNAAVQTGKGGAGLVTGYWPSWSASTLPPENIAWSKFDMVFYAFAVPTSSGSITIDDASMLRRFVKAAQTGKTKAILSLGGWGQSGGFSDSVKTESARTKFIGSVLNVISTYNLDGVDFDWEYPGNVQGGPSNPADTGNFQQFLTDLRAKTPKGKILSAAVPQQVWQGSSGNPVGSVARAGAALDHIVIMNYDVWGSSSTPGPNAPLGNLCGNSTQPVASAAGGVKAWTSAGFPRGKILLGVPSYGYINDSTKRRLKQRAHMDARSVQANESDDTAPHALQRRAALKSMDGSTTSGQINFNQLISQGALSLNTATGTYEAGSGFTKYWDKCSDTPFLASGSRVVTYDDPDSLYDKADFARLAKIAGVAMWSIDGDTKGNVLINSLAAGLQGK